MYWQSKHLPQQPVGCIFCSICLIYVCIIILLSAHSYYLYKNYLFFQETDLTPMLRSLADAVCRTFPLSRYTSVTRSEKLQAFVADHLPRSVYDIIYTWTHFQISDSAFIRIEKSKVDMFMDILKNYYYSVLHVVLVYSCNYMCCGHVGLEYQL